MDANQFCRDDHVTPAHVAHRLARARDGGTAAFAGDIRMYRAPYGASRVRERAINRVIAARCMDFAFLGAIAGTRDVTLPDD